VTSTLRTGTIGDAWISEGVLPVLQAPSAVIPTEFNFLLNPSHKDFRSFESENHSASGLTGV